MKDYAERMQVYQVMGLLVREHIGGGIKSRLLESAEAYNRNQRYLIYDNTILML